MTLYERIGGEEGIEAVVSAFYERVFADPTLRPFFDGVHADKLTAMQREFFSAALGGPVQYSGASLRSAHANRGITSRELTLFTDHLFEALIGTDLDRNDASAIVSRIATSTEDIIGGVSEDG